jgi:glycosyltransferase involved in cell wall biosynthesis
MVEKEIIMNRKLPLISCICVTRNKPAMLKRAVECFLTQSYPEKELVIVYENDDIETLSLLDAGEIVAGADIQLIGVKAVPKAPLGELRNIGIRAASGAFICQWDDDDWYHMNRLTEQYQELSRHNRHGSIMTQWLVFNALNNRAYISNVRPWEGSILCRKELLLRQPYEQKHIGEDTPTVDYLLSQNNLHLINDMPGLYIYVYHGGNTWHHDHWSYIFRCSKGLPRKDSLEIADILSEKYSVYTASLLLDEILESKYAGRRALI